MQNSMIPGWCCHQNQCSKRRRSALDQSTSQGLGLENPKTAQHAKAVVINAE